MCVYVYTYMFLCVCVCVFVCRHIYTFTYIYTSIYACICVYIHVCVCARVSVYVHMCVNVCVCLSVYLPSSSLLLSSAYSQSLLISFSTSLIPYSVSRMIPLKVGGAGDVAGKE